jgi:hypothetical protein
MSLLAPRSSQPLSRPHPLRDHPYRHWVCHGPHHHSVRPFPWLHDHNVQQHRPLRRRPLDRLPRRQLLRHRPHVLRAQILRSALDSWCTASRKVHTEFRQPEKPEGGIENIQIIGFHPESGVVESRARRRAGRESGKTASSSTKCTSKNSALRKSAAEWRSACVTI